MGNTASPKNIVTNIIAADGKGEGFGNQISIQTVAIIRAARAAQRVYSVDSGRPVGAFYP